MHHYAHHLGDYRAHTAHLTMLEDGAYRRLLDLYYMHEKPLPADVSACQRLAAARSKEERAAIEVVLHEFFTLEADGWHQSRADEEVANYHEKAETARRNGKGGGRPKTQTKPRDNQPGYSSVPESNLCETVTVNRKPITNNQLREEGAHAPRANEGADDGRRGTRLPEDWQPAQAERDFAADLNLDPEATASTFRDYWAAIPGAKGRKTDWPATWRNWCRRDADNRRTPARGGAGLRPSAIRDESSAFARAADILAGR